MALFFKSNQTETRKWYESFGESIESLGLALIMALMIKTSVVEAFKIPTGSMEDTLLAGDFLLANKFVYGMQLPIPFVNVRLPAIENPKPGDVIIFKYPEDPKVNYIKRCVAVEGQVVEIRDKELYVDGEYVPLPREGKHEDTRVIPYYNTGRWGPTVRDNLPPTIVPEGKLFVMGDNRDNSSDSRYWGFLDRNLVMGRALIIHFSWKPDPGAPKVEASDIWSIPRLVGYNMLHFPGRLRWNRLAKIVT